MQTPRMPLTPHLDLSVPPPNIPFIRGPSPLVAVPPPHLNHPSGPPPVHFNQSPAPRNVHPNRTQSFPMNEPFVPFLLIRYNDKYILRFNNCELRPQYMIEKDLWHRFGTGSCSVVIKRNPETGAPLTDDEVQIHFNELYAAKEAFKQLSAEEMYYDIQFHEECVPPLDLLDTIEVSQSLDHFYCLTFKEESSQLGWDIQQLKEIFSNFGHVANVNKDKVGNVYIRYSDKRSAQLALFHLADDHVIQLKNARNLKDKIPPQQYKNMIDTKNNVKTDSLNGKIETSNAEDDSASTVSADLSMLEMKAIEDAILNNSTLLE